MFKQISSTRTKVDDMYHDDLNGRVQTMEGVMSDHEKRIKLLEYRSIYLSLLSRSISDHHLRCGGWLNLEFSKREKHSGWAIKTIYKK